MSSLAPEFRRYDTDTLRLLTLCRALNRLDARIQKLVAEIILLRLFSMFENFVSVVPAKLVAGARYLNGSAPEVLADARSARGAENLFHTHGRRRDKRLLRWSNAPDIKDNVRYVLAATDHYVTTVDQHSAFIDEIRRVRNRIAHNNERSRRNYRDIVRRYYGACLNHVTPGTLLLVPRRTPRLLDYYINSLRIFAHELVKEQP